MAFVSNGVTMFNAGALVASAGNQIFISSQTASNSASVSFTSGLTSTYKAYKFVFSNIHARTGTNFQFNLSTDSGSNYNVTKTSTAFNAIHAEADNVAQLGYATSDDLAQSTGYQTLTGNTLGTASDDSLSGSLTLFNPASTTYVKHWIANSSINDSDSRNRNLFCAGYGNTTSAINAIRFQMDSGNFDGTIYLYGIKT